MSRPMPRLFLIRHGSSLRRTMLNYPLTICYRRNGMVIEWVNKSLYIILYLLPAIIIFIGDMSVNILSIQMGFISPHGRPDKRTSPSLLEVRVKSRKRHTSLSVKNVSCPGHKITCSTQAILGLIRPENLCTVFVSPRQRAFTTFRLLFAHIPQPPHHTISEEVREWDYGYIWFTKRGGNTQHLNR